MKTGWHPQDIIAAVRKRGTSLQALGRRHGFAINTFNKALTHRFPNAHAIISDYIKVPRNALWPEWYDENDRPLLRTRRDLRRFAALPDAAE